jgi:hypothetical protein
MRRKSSLVRLFRCPVSARNLPITALRAQHSSKRVFLQIITINTTPFPDVSGREATLGRKMAICRKLNLTNR